MDAILGLLFLVACWYGYKAWMIHSARKGGFLSPSDIEITVVRRYEDEDQDLRDEIEYLEGIKQSEVVSVQAQLLLYYTDSGGARTRRLVDVREADIGWTNGYLCGVCHLRNAFRTFRIDRISKCVVPETGEVVNIQNYLREIYIKSPTYSVNEAFANANDALRALLYIGKADGRLTKKEKGIMLEFFREIAQDDRIEMADLEKSFDYYAIPSMHTFRLICGRIAKLSLPDKKRVLEMSIKMVETEKRISAEEIEAVNYLGKRLSLPVPELQGKAA